MNSSIPRDAGKIIQRTFLIITFIAVAHVVRPFSVRGVVRHLFRTAQSLSFVLPGAAVCTLERADYVAAILSGGLAEELPPLSIEGETKAVDAQLAKVTTEFNPEYDLPEPDATKNALSCSRKKESRQNNATVARQQNKVVPPVKADAQNLALAWQERESPVKAIRTRTHRAHETELQEIVSLAAVELPEFHRTEVPINLPVILDQTSLTAMQEFARKVSTQLRQSPCPPVPPARSARKAVVQTSTREREIIGFGQLAQKKGLNPTSEFKVRILFVEDKVKSLPVKEIKLQCTKDGHIFTC